MLLVADDVVFRRTVLFVTYISKFLDHMDPDMAEDNQVSDYQVRILHTAYFVAVYPCAFFKAETLCAKRFYASACHAAKQLDRIALAVVTKTPLSLQDLHGLFYALRSLLDAFTNWRAEDKTEDIATDAQRTLGSCITIVDSLSHDEIVNGSPRVSAMCIEITKLVNDVYDSTEPASVCRLMALVNETREKFPTKSFQPWGFTRSCFTIDAIINRATPPIEDGVFHIDLEDDTATKSVRPTTQLAIQGALIYCYAVTAGRTADPPTDISGTPELIAAINYSTIRRAPDSLSIMMLNHTVRELKKYPSITPWAREFYEQIQDQHIEEIREDRAGDAYMEHNSLIGANIAPPCTTPRALSD